jgi:hypothetical protein
VLPVSAPASSHPCLPIERKRLVTDVLIKMGVDIANNRFYILRDAVLAYREYEHPANICQQEIFTSISEKYGTNWKCAHRNVRALIKSGKTKDIYHWNCR